MDACGLPWQVCRTSFPNMPTKPFSSCTDCDGFSRRRFLKTTTAAAALLPFGSIVEAADKPTKAAKSPETLVAQLYASLTDRQRVEVCFPFDHPLQSEINNNWFITKARIGKDFDKPQQELIREIFLGMHSPQYAKTVLGQVEHDNNEDGGFGACSLALFGQPGTGKFEFVFSGRHVTRRCDGDSVEGAAFGGPIFYGHAALSANEKPDHPQNAYWYQAKRANHVFQMLDGKQRETALLGDSRKEQKAATVKLTGKTTGLPGLRVGDMTKDQQAEVRKVMADVLAPFRKADADEAMKLVEKNGFEHLHMSFYKNQDIGNDGVWDVWQIEGPSMLSYFRGAPHVHAWLHIREKA